MLMQNILVIFFYFSGALFYLLPNMLKVDTELDFVNFPNNEYIEYIEELWKKEKNPHLVNIKHLNFFYIPDDSEKSREQLRRYISIMESNHSFVNIVMVSEQKNLAFIGWEQDIVAFYLWKIDERHAGMRILVDRLMKFPPYQDAISKKLKIKYKGHFELVDTKDICFCAGRGNYTEIYLTDGTMREESKALGKLAERLSGVSSIKRIGKSLIVNRNRVVKVSGQDVWFAANAGAPRIKQRLGNAYIKELRKFVYWY